MGQIEHLIKKVAAANQPDVVLASHHRFVVRKAFLHHLIKSNKIDEFLQLLQRNLLLEAFVEGLQEFVNRKRDLEFEKIMKILSKDAGKVAEDYGLGDYRLQRFLQFNREARLYLVVKKVFCIDTLKIIEFEHATAVALYPPFSKRVPICVKDLIKQKRFDIYREWIKDAME